MKLKRKLLELYHNTNEMYKIGLHNIYNVCIMGVLVLIGYLPLLLGTNNTVKYSLASAFSCT